MIFGVGADIIKISRIKKSMKKKTFISRLFAEEEVLKCKKKIRTFLIVLQKNSLQKRPFPKH